MKIRVPRKQLQAFRAACRRAYPTELIAVLHGERSADIVRITDIKPIEHLADADQILVKPSTMRRSKIRALRNGTDWIGTIHSHCYVESDPCCWHLSKTDIVSALKDGEVVCGLVYVYEKGHKSEVHWYVPHPIPEVEYE